MLVDVECKIHLQSVLIKPTSTKIKLLSALLVPATFSMGGSKE